MWVVNSSTRSRAAQDPNFPSLFQTDVKKDTEDQTHPLKNKALVIQVHF